MSSESIERFFDEATSWQDEMRSLRSLVLASGLVEDWKWNQPCYTAAGKNVAMIAPFARHCSLSFFQGVLLDDPAGLLTTPGKNSQSARQVRVTSVSEIEANRDAIAAPRESRQAHRANPGRQGHPRLRVRQVGGDAAL